MAATDVAQGGVVSPGGVGFDISCGVRLLVAHDLDRREIAPHLSAVMDELDRATPGGVRRGAVWRFRGRDELEQVLRGGAYLVRADAGIEDVLDVMEEHRVRRVPVMRTTGWPA